MSFRDLPIAGFYSADDDRLNQFYVPVLSEAVAYDRMSGYFRSSALVVAAAGLSRFFAHNGTMRLIVGAELTDDDVNAMTDGEPLTDVLVRRLLAAPLEAADIVTKHRLATLAWLVREGRLQIRIGIPLDADGRPVKGDQAERYFHTKCGVFTDARGDRLAFMGSVNESDSGWRTNHETFTVAKSWRAETWADVGAPIVARFDAHWAGSPARGWAVIDLPEAVRENLLARIRDMPSAPPVRDPEETAALPESGDDRLRLAFVAAAPRLRGGTGVGFATAGVEPWPHQLAIARRIVETWPRSYLLADEVGLGKTIEAGLVLRELLVSGKAKTALILTPWSVLKQWQEELFEKFALDIPRYDRGRFWNAQGIEIPWAGDTPWNAFPVLLASSHLARRTDRRSEVLAAQAWDIVFVDEAHHARRSGSKPTDTRNTLLTLLQAMKAYQKWQALYLATATPMQMHPHEAWDLLDLLGLSGQWGGVAENFVTYYTELRQPSTNRRWGFLEGMAADYFSDPKARPDAVIQSEIKDQLGNVAAHPILNFHTNGLTAESAREMSPASIHWLDEWLRTNTPMHDRVFRTTRTLLLRYKEQGILDPATVIPHRTVHDEFITMSEAEERLYKRIETYIARYYDLYMTGPKSNRPLGFIMTVYRRRLTSSLYAIRRSFERRLAALQAKTATETLFDPDDLSALETSTRFDPDSLPALATAARVDEIAELQSFLADLERTPPDETKMSRLHAELEAAFRGPHETAIVFTQFADTMDYVRDQLLSTYGSRVICYSGRGGERYDLASKKWHPLSKAEVKRLFREGREVKVLIGTDSLSEGLNLQTCAKLINYDMPWNFMRVEQRIGRIDRINGRPEVEISNYFYRGTIEEQIYEGIGEDFDWFSDVVGPAQPVLSTVEQVIEDVAMRAPGAQRDAEVATRIREIRAAIADANARALTLSDIQGGPEPNDTAAVPAITLEELERVLLGVPATRRYLRPHPSVDSAFFLATSRGEVLVTFRRQVLEESAPDVVLLTYGTWELEDLLHRAGVPIAAENELQANGRTISSLAELEKSLA